MTAQRFRGPPSSLDRAQFVVLYGRVYEHSPWIAEAAWAAGLKQEHDTVEGLHRTLAAIVDAAPRKRQLALLCAHPDLAGRLAMRGELTAESTAEQASAGLDQCTPAEFQRFTELNEAYKAKFPFPFIMAVKGKSRGEILEAFERRIHHTEEVEFRTALSEVHKIALLRLRDL
ncbi:2-oxo-4-hydroxy-4-carboxy-5-ureidoimidazoline decarboxylase [Dongia deserti]|uniref:2-oxo-4-hydroxy-4-carboxy-5-ureidoimidazoline decarboxylase n=1 Tax=Dongia deserti TaxID=2268030 RepID=UPI0025492919|nr:2-oxo-4-hydroxy-4-carboxy-5-ureidoimidazoline decarboxylase [Dongia deserti]